MRRKSSSKPLRCPETGLTCMNAVCEARTIVANTSGGLKMDQRVYDSLPELEYLAGIVNQEFCVRTTIDALRAISADPDRDSYIRTAAADMANMFIDIQRGTSQIY